MSEYESEEDSEFDLETYIEVLKPKVRKAFKKLMKEQDSLHEFTRRDLMYTCSRIDKLEEKLQKYTDKDKTSFSVDSSGISVEFTADRAFSKRWPWISIDCKSKSVQCNRCGQSEQYEGFRGFSGDNFDWFMATHGACSYKTNKT